MAEKRRQSTNHSGAIQLHPRMWGRVFAFVDDSLDDLARVKAAGCVLVSCKDLKRILAAGGRELWQPLIQSVVAVAPCLGLPTEPDDAEKPWVRLTMLNTTCIHCRNGIFPDASQVHPTLGVRMCARCLMEPVSYKMDRGLINVDAAIDEYLLTDEYLAGLPYFAHYWENTGTYTNYYVRRHIKIAQARRFGTRRNLHKVNIIHWLRMEVPRQSSLHEISFGCHIVNANLPEAEYPKLIDDLIEDTIIREIPPLSDQVYSIQYGNEAYPPLNVTRYVLDDAFRYDLCGVPECRTLDRVCAWRARDKEDRRRFVITLS